MSEEDDLLNSILGDIENSNSQLDRSQELSSDEHESLSTQLSKHDGSQMLEKMRLREELLDMHGNYMLKKVLIVDDSSVMRKIMATQIQKQYPNVLIDQAENGQIGLELTKAVKDYSLIVTDVNMPVCNGYEFIEQAKKDIDTPIIIMSEDNTKETIGNSFLSGANHFIHKPTMKLQLAKTILPLITLHDRRDEIIIFRQSARTNFNNIRIQNFFTKTDPKKAHQLHIFEESNEGIGALYFGELSVDYGTPIVFPDKKVFQVCWLNKLFDNAYRFGLRQLN